MEKDIDYEKILIEIEKLYVKNRIINNHRSTSDSLDEQYQKIAEDFIHGDVILYNWNISIDYIKVWKIVDIGINKRGNYYFQVKIVNINLKKKILPGLLYSNFSFTDLIEMNIKDITPVKQNIKWVYNRLRLSGAHKKLLKSLFKDASIEDILFNL